MATSPLGLEAVVAREIKDLGYETQSVENGRIFFQADALGIARCNLWLRAADRVFLVMGQFEARTFDELFEGVKALPWSDLLPRDCRFPVEGRSVKSQLASVPACQGIVKKAIVASLQQTYDQEWFTETGDEYAVEVSLQKDQATITIDTSGAGLHKRGYRTHTGLAPIKETMAAALVLLSRWHPHRPFADPLCGTGTIAIEAAMIAGRVAPGLRRDFASEAFPWIGPKPFNEAREEAFDLRYKTAQPDFHIQASDIDSRAVRMAQMHADGAGVSHMIDFSVSDIQAFVPQAPYGCIVTNPPYGERLDDRDTVRVVETALGHILQDHPTWSLFVLTSSQYLERHIGRSADKNRKLYNARIECKLYQYLGPLPPRRGS
ncbi:MAG: class I SAM-dependent RNA methyltransferase [Firmicutes bacterium]|nr:class I SAM-dependent RNA methyltransferase [Bacillota bacterium]